MRQTIAVGIVVRMMLAFVRDAAEATRRCKLRRFEAAPRAQAPFEGAQESHVRSTWLFTPLLSRRQKDLFSSFHPCVSCGFSRRGFAIDALFDRLPVLVEARS